MKLDYHIVKSVVNAFFGLFVGRRSRPTFFKVTEAYPELDHITRAYPAIRREFANWLSNELEPVIGTPFESWMRVPYPLPLLTGRDRLAPDEPAAIHRLVDGSTLFVLCTDGDAAEHRLRAGQALQRVLLTATAAGVAVSFLNQPIEVSALRGELAAVLGTTGVPQMLLRLGYSRSTAPRTGRRPATPVAGDNVQT